MPFCPCLLISSPRGGQQQFLKGLNGSNGQENPEQDCWAAKNGLFRWSDRAAPARDDQLHLGAWQGALLPPRWGWGQTVWFCYSTHVLRWLTTASGTGTAPGDGTCRGLGLVRAVPSWGWDVSLMERLAGSVVVCLCQHGGAGRCTWVMYVKSPFLPFPPPPSFQSSWGKIVACG